MNSKILYNLCDIKVQKMDRMNQAQGTHFSRNMITENKEDILDALNTYRWCKVERIEAFRDKQRRPNQIHILTFVTRELPDNVLCGYGVKRFYSNPLRCGICCQLGYTYGLARKKFEEQFDRKKETYEQVTGRNEDQMQKEQEKELAAIKERQRNMEEI
jgi:hypothetical protein